MSVDPTIINALTSFVSQAQLQQRALLIGGQALRDWLARQQHVYQQEHLQGLLPTPRVTTDIDVLIEVETEGAKELLKSLLDQQWIRDERSTFRFHWRSDESVTLDLIELINPDARSRMKSLVRLGHGGREISAVRVLPPWIRDAGLLEPCFTPELARIGINRLAHLGLISAKLVAVHAVVEGLTNTATATMTEASPAPPSWIAREDRLGKDLHDLHDLLARLWSEQAWTPYTPTIRRQVQVQLTTLHQTLTYLRERPARMRSDDYARLQELVLALDAFVPTDRR